MKTMKKGDLVYIPSEVKLVQFAEDDSVSRYTRTEKPINCLIENVGQNWYRVIYQGERWSVKAKHVYTTDNHGGH
mgnify:CR=1 FL=1